MGQRIDCNSRRWLYASCSREQLQQFFLSKPCIRLSRALPMASAMPPAVSYALVGVNGSCFVETVGGVSTAALHRQSWRCAERVSAIRRARPWPQVTMPKQNLNTAPMLCSESSIVRAPKRSLPIPTPRPTAASKSIPQRTRDTPHPAWAGTARVSRVRRQ
jgi:hypothetical protein